MRDTFDNNHRVNAVVFTAFHLLIVYSMTLQLLVGAHKICIANTWSVHLAKYSGDVVDGISRLLWKQDRCMVSDLKLRYNLD